MGDYVLLCIYFFFFFFISWIWECLLVARLLFFLLLLLFLFDNCYLGSCNGWRRRQRTAGICDISIEC